MIEAFIILVAFFAVWVVVKLLIRVCRQHPKQTTAEFIKDYDLGKISERQKKEQSEKLISQYLGD